MLHLPPVRSGSEGTGTALVSFGGHIKYWLYALKYTTRPVTHPGKCRSEPKLLSSARLYSTSTPTVEPSAFSIKIIQKKESQLPLQRVSVSCSFCKNRANAHNVLSCYQWRLVRIYRRFIKCETSGLLLPDNETTLMSWIFPSFPSETHKNRDGKWIVS